MIVAPLRRSRFRNDDPASLHYSRATIQAKGADEEDVARRRIVAALESNLTPTVRNSHQTTSRRARATQFPVHHASTSRRATAPDARDVRSEALGDPSLARARESASDECLRRRRPDNEELNVGCRRVKR